MENKTFKVIDRIMDATPEQMDEILAGVEVIMNGGTEAEARAAALAVKKKRGPVTKLEEHRFLFGLTRDQLAEKAGVDVAVITGLEQGTIESCIGRDLLKLANALDTTADELF